MVTSYYHNSICNTPKKPETPRSLVKVYFQILHSPTDREKAPIVTCVYLFFSFANVGSNCGDIGELGPEVNVSELLWTFSRLPDDRRVTLKQNPHFYLSKDLSDRPLAYNNHFVLKPLKDLKTEKDLKVMILSDRTGQIYFDYKKFSKTYGNIWRPHNAIILKGIVIYLTLSPTLTWYLDPQGTLEAANRISSKINGEVSIWQRGGDRHDKDLTEWTKVLDEALHAPDTDWLIRPKTSLAEAFEIEVTGGWVNLFSIYCYCTVVDQELSQERCSPIAMPEPAPVFGIGNSITSMPSHEDVPASRVPPIGSTPAGSARGLEVSQRVKSHPRKMATTVGQRQSVVMSAPPVTQPKSPLVQQPTTRLAPQNSSSLPLQGMPTRMTYIPSLPEAQDKLKIRTAPTPALAVPAASSTATPGTHLAAAPPTRVDDMARVPTPTLSITDGPTTGRSRRPTIVAEVETARRTERVLVLPPMNPEQSTTGPPPSKGSSSTPVLQSIAPRITSRIRTRDLVSRHKPQAVEPPTISPSVGSPTWSKSSTSTTSQPALIKPDPNLTDSGIEIWDYNSRRDRHTASDKKGLADPSEPPTVLEGSDRSSRIPLAHRDSTMSHSKPHSKSSPKLPASMPEPPKTSGSLQVESPASTPPGHGGAFLSRKPQESFQSVYLEISTPPRSSTPSSMTHASTAATSTPATLVTPPSSISNLSSYNSKAEPTSWFRRNLLDPFKTRLRLATTSA